MIDIRKITLRLLGAQWIAIGFVGASSFFVSVLIARVLGPVNFGAYASAVSLASIASILIDGGFSKIIQREQAYPSSHLSISANQLLKLAYGHIVFVTLLSCTLGFIIFPNKLPIIISALLFFSVLVLNQVILAELRGQGRLIREALWQILGRSLTTISIVLAVIFGANLPWHMFAVQFIGALIFTYILIKSLFVKPDFNLSWSLYRFLLPFIWLDLATMVYFRSDMVILGFLDVPNANIGHYGVAYRLIESVILISSPVGLILFRWFRQNALSQIFPASRLVLLFSLVILVALVLATSFYIAADDVIRVAYGARFTESAALLKVLCWALIFIIPNGVLGQVALANGKESSLAWLATIIAVMNVVGNLLIIPEYGVFAAAWMTIITEALLTFGLLGIIAIQLKNEVNLILPSK